MNHKNVFHLIVILVYILTAYGCANIVAPTGGPRDSLPPILISTSPADSSKMFKANRINFVFNEYVEVQDVQQNLVVSPTPLINPVIEFKLRTVTVKLKDTLEDNTTYAINFGNSLRDINEGNILKNFTYVFSTGTVIDSNTYNGRVLLAENGKPDSTLVALLHRSGEDSAVYKERPRYYSKLDSLGRFNFRFLAPGTYYLYALKDEGGTKKYTSPSQLFGFASEPVVIGGDSKPVTLYVFVEEEEEQKPLLSRPPAAARPAKKEEDRRLKFQTSLDNGRQDLLSDFQLKFADPLKSFDSSRMVLTDEEFNPVPGYTITKDSTNTLLTIQYPWKPDISFNLILDKEFASDSLDRMLLKADTVNFKTKTNADYGSIRLRFPTLDLSRRPVLQLLENQKVFASYPLSKKELYQKLFKPGQYEMRILYDSNGNGIWDTGKFFGERRQPEKVVAIDKQLQIRANWDNEVNISLGSD